MAGRTITPKNQKDSGDPLRFTPGDIVRAIEEVESAGLTVYAVEITLAGAINISTQPPPSIIKQRATPKRMQENELVGETRLSNKKQA